MWHFLCSTAEILYPKHFKSKLRKNGSDNSMSNLAYAMLYDWSSKTVNIKFLIQQGCLVICLARAVSLSSLSCFSLGLQRK